MATLKISDLSVGDWVRWRGRDTQIAEITQLVYSFGSRKIDFDNRVTLRYKEDIPVYRESVMLDDLDPVPITPEILETNGWRIIEKEVLGEDYEYNGDERVWDNDDNMIDICEQKQGVFWHSYGSEYYFHRLYYVHQLQHLMRLYGADKEINL